MKKLALCCAALSSCLCAASATASTASEGAFQWANVEVVASTGLQVNNRSVSPTIAAKVTQGQLIFQTSVQNNGTADAIANKWGMDISTSSGSYDSASKVMTIYKDGYDSTTAAINQTMKLQTVVTSTESIIDDELSNTKHVFVKGVKDLKPGEIGGRVNFIVNEANTLDSGLYSLRAVAVRYQD